MLRAAALACLLACAAWQAAAAGPVEGTVGVNKFDLMLQYLGWASGGDGSPRYRKVTEAMARKAMDDAQSAGIRYFRISATGYAPSGFGLRGDLDLWRSDPAAFWAVMDRMMDDLSARDIRLIPSFVWNLRQFPSMNRETVHDLIANPDSRSYRMLEQYVTEFVTRYRGKPGVLFYEIGNELNLNADLDAAGRCVKQYGREPCAAQGNFSTDEMIAFTSRLAARIRALDPALPISSGHSFPRPSAQHLRGRPEYSSGGPDWTRDTPEELADYVEATHAGLDILSVHIYEQEPMPAFAGTDHAALIELSSNLARRLGKKLFVGEIGDRSAAGIAPNSYLDRALSSIATQRVPYAALWIWQYYQTNTYRSFDHQNTIFNIEPGYSDALIGRLATLNGAPSTPSQGGDTRPPSVIITWPLDCASVQGPVEVHVVASDDSGKSPRVELRAGQRTLAAGDRPPYILRIDGLPAGEHELTAVAEDGSGNRATWTSTVATGAVQPGARCARY